MKLDCQIPHLLSLWTHTALLYVYHEGGNGNPLQYFHLENIYGQRSLVGYHPKGGKELDRTEWLSSKRSISYEKKQSIFARNYASILDPILDKEDDLNLFRCMLYHSNTRGCHDLVAHWCLSLGNFVDCSSQGSSVHGIFPRQEYWSGLPFTFPSFQFSHSVMSNSLWPHESQHVRPPCPSPTPGVHSDSRPSSRWCHPAISSSVVPFSSCPQSLPASESFPMSQLFEWGAKVLEFQL